MDANDVRVGGVVADLLLGHDLMNKDVLRGEPPGQQQGAIGEKVIGKFKCFVVHRRLVKCLRRSTD